MLRTAWKWCESAIMLVLLAGGGAAGGYYFAYAQFRDYAAQQRADHQAEVQRLQSTLTTVLEAVAPLLSDAAQQSADAAREAKSAAATAASAAQAIPEHRSGRP